MRAVFSQCGGVEDEFVAFLLSPGCSRAPAVAFVGRELRGGQSKDLTADSTRPSMRCAHSTSSSTASTATSRQRAWTSYGKFLRLSPLVPLRLGAPTSGSLSSLWLAKKIENLAALAACCAAESLRLDSTPMLATSSTAAASTPSADTARRTLTLSSGGSSGGNAGSSKLQQLRQLQQLQQLQQLRHDVVGKSRCARGDEERARPTMVVAAETDLGELFRTACGYIVMRT